MIDNKLSKALRAAGVLYVLLFSMTSWVFTKIQSDGFLSLEISKYILMSGFAIATLSMILSFLHFNIPRRMGIKVLVFGALIFPGVFLFFGSVSFAYLFTVSPNVRFWLIIQVIVYTVLWSAYSIGIRQKLIDKTQYMNKYFRITDAAIIFTPPKDQKLLIPAPISDSTVLGKLWGKLVLILSFFMFCGYPISRLLSNEGGVSNIYLFLFMLGSPLVMYLTVKVITGAYLWIYKVYKLEKLHGKPVLMAENANGMWATVSI